jgi:hypothetical protein
MKPTESERLDLEIFAVSFRAVASFESPKTKKESWRASPLLATKYPPASQLSRQGLNSTGIKSRIATARTKYLAMSLSPSVV